MEGIREPWGTLGKLREYKGIMGITTLPTPLGPPPLKDILKIVFQGSHSFFCGRWGGSCYPIDYRHP